MGAARLTYLGEGGTAVDIVPGSALEAAYGGSGNLGPLPAGEPQNADKSALAN